MLLFAVAINAVIASLRANESLAADGRIVFTDVSQECGISFVHSDGGTGQRYVVESMTAGLALFDYDGDGLEDLYLLNGAVLDPTAEKRLIRNALYRNLGDWKFEDVTDAAGVGDPSFSLGVAASDIDGDGDLDLYVTNFGPNTLFLNNGDGSFSKASNAWGVEDGSKFGAGAAFVDIDADGDLDLYAANYQKFELHQHKVRVIAGHKYHPGPLDYPPQEDSLFRNNGDGTFTDVSKDSGISQVAGTGMGVIASDVDQDGDSDIIVANDSAANFLFINDGQGNFSEEGLLVGFAFDRKGNPNGNMGVECGDIDNDGMIDVFTTTYQQEMPVLYQNQGGFFSDITNLTRIDTSLFPHVNWGTGLADFDNDGDQDLFIACGHFMDNIQYIADTTTLKVQNYLLVNNGSGKFTAAIDPGNGLDVVESSRGAAFADLDLDGDLDAVILNSNAPTTLLRNESTAGGSSLRVNLSQPNSNRQAIGARVEMKVNGQAQVAEVYAGRGYQSHYGTTLHFGMGDWDGSPVAISVHWPGGAKSSYTWAGKDSEILIQANEQQPKLLRKMGR